MEDIELPEDVMEKLSGGVLEDVAIKVEYKNWKGEVGIRTIFPLDIFHGSTDYHKEEQWLLKVWDLDKNEHRTYTLKDVQRWL